MGILRSLLIKLGLANLKAERSPISVFLLDDDHRRHRWFTKRFDGDELDIAETVEEAKEFLAENTYDAIFLDHDLLPHHYESNDHDDFATTGYADRRISGRKPKTCSAPRQSSSTRATPTPRFGWCKKCAIRAEAANTARFRCSI